MEFKNHLYLVNTKLNKIGRINDLTVNRLTRVLIFKKKLN